MAYRHEGFWQCMDTLRDKRLLEQLWDAGRRRPWRSRRTLTCASSSPATRDTSGTVVVPALLERRARGRRPRHALFDGCASGPAPTRDRDAVDVDIRDVEARRPGAASTPSCTSRRSRTTRSATSSPSRPSRSTTSATVALAPKRREARRPTRSLRLVAAASTARASGTSLSTRTRRSGRSRPYGESKVRAEEDLLTPRRRRLQPVLPPQRDRLRRLAAVADRPRGEQPRRAALPPTEVLVLSDGTPWRPLVHVEDIARGIRGRARGGPRRRCTRRRSTSAAPAENYRVREIAEIVAGRSPGLAASRSRARRAPTRAPTASTSRIAGARPPASRHAGRSPTGAASSLDAYAAHWPRGARAEQHGSRGSQLDSAQRDDGRWRRRSTLGRRARGGCPVRRERAAGPARRRSSTSVRRPRRASRSRTRYLTAGAARASTEPVYPLHASSASGAGSCSSTSTCRPSDIFSRLRLLLVVLDDLARARASLRRTMIAARSGSDPSSLVVEVASNDGYLLRNFVERGIPVLGIEPARNVAAVRAIELGMPTRVRCSSGARRPPQLARERGRRDLIVGNNVLAHVPDLNDFVAGLALLLAPRRRSLTIEFPHLLRLIEERAVRHDLPRALLLLVAA